MPKPSNDQRPSKKLPYWILLGGILLALVTVIIAQQTVRAFQRTTPIVVAKQDIQAYVPAEKDKFEVVDWPTKYVPEGALHSLNELDGKWTKGVMTKNTPASSNTIGNSSGNLTASLRGKGTRSYRYVSIPADDLTTFGGVLTAGDYVDVVGTIRVGQSGQYKKLGEKVLVEEVIKQSDNKKIIGVRLYTTLKQAEEIEQTLANGKVRLWITTPD